MRSIRVFLLSVPLLLLFCTVGCTEEPSAESFVNAIERGVSPENTGEENSRALQALLDELTEAGGTVYLPAGEYEFAENGRQTIGSHCIKMRSNIRIVGDGEATVLKPVGRTPRGLDMFYFNEYLDTGEAVYLENCSFDGFVIDAAGTSCDTYTSAGKGFMFNLFRGCHWKNVTVKYTEGTGFGVDCPIDSTIRGCTAIGCGKAATEDSGGASGFGIGFGYCEDESMSITDCKAYGNRKFGFFFEHQGRFNGEMYAASVKGTFTVNNCRAAENLFGFGGICAVNTVYEECVAEDSSRYGFYFEDSSGCRVDACQSKNGGEAAFALIQTKADGSRRVTDVTFSGCLGADSPVGVLLLCEDTADPMGDNRVENCRFVGVGVAARTVGRMESLVLTGNLADTRKTAFEADITVFRNSGNSWN